MKLGLMYVNAGPFGDPENLAHLARTAEAVGIESLWTVEHAAIPVGYQSVYPYDRRGRMPGPESVPIADPLVALAYCAAVTERLRLATGVLILAQRHPIYVAKELATLVLAVATLQHPPTELLHDQSGAELDRHVDHHPSLR